MKKHSVAKLKNRCYIEIVIIGLGDRGDGGA